MRPVSDEVRAGEGVGDTDFVGVCSWRFQILALPNSKTIHFDTLFTLWASFILLRIQNSDWHDRIIITNRSWLPGASICVVTSSQAFPVWIIFRTIISREKNCFRGRPHRTAKEKKSGRGVKLFLCSFTIWILLQLNVDTTHENQARHQRLSCVQLFRSKKILPCSRC